MFPCMKLSQNTKCYYEAQISSYQRLGMMGERGKKKGIT